MTILDQRLTQTEDRLSTVLAHSRNLVNVPPQTATSQYPVSSNNPYFRNHDDAILQGGPGHEDYSYRDEGEDEDDDEDDEEAGSDESVDGGGDMYGVQKNYLPGVDQDYSEDEEDRDDDYSFGEGD